MTEILPIRFGKYLLLEKIAIGGMAELYRARITGTQGFEKIVAIKKLLPHLNDEVELVKAFIHEAKLAALLQHQNIVNIFDFGSMEGTYFIAMEHLFGKDLHLITEKSEEKKLPLSLDHALYIAAKICEGLDYAHQLKDFQGNPLNIIHRDISPQNILVTYDGEVKIVDFGIAKAAGQNTKTREGVIKGKVSYMSPEQAAGKAIDKRSDIFSAGILLYEMVTGSRMFDGDALQVLSKVREVQFQPSRDVASELPPRVHEILDRALAKDPAERYQSSADMLLDLEECLYENDLRPTARSVAQDMKALFKQDIVDEERFMRETMQIDLRGPSGDGQETEPQKTRVLEKTLRISLPDIMENVKKRRSRYAALAALLAMALGLFLIFSYDSRPVSALHKMLSLLPGTSVQPEDIGSPPSDAVLPDERGVPQDQEPAVTSLPKPVVPEKSSPTSVPSLHAQLELAMTALENGEFEEAVSLFEESLSREPGLREKISDAYGQALVGQAISTSEEAPQKAETILVKALALNPENSRAHFELASLYAKQGNYEKAAATYQKVAELDPQFSEPLFNLAYIYYLQGDLARAEETYYRVVELAPPYLDEVYFNLAVVQEEQGKKAQSIESLERTLALNPDSQEAKNYLLRLKGESKKP
jgi:serine/threonine protein kinase/TolA-binding protein